VVHDPGKIVADLAAALALGGDCLADIAVLWEQPALTGPVASDPVVSRLVSLLAADLPRALKAIRSARAAARERAWALAGEDAPGGDGGLVTVDLDATIVIAHSEKEQAAPTWKKTFDLLTELPYVSAAQTRCAPQQPIAWMPGRSESPGRRGLVVSPIAAETGHTGLNRSPTFSSLRIFGVNCSGPRVLLQHP
jgi:hypothetical protein